MIGLPHAPNQPLTSTWTKPFAAWEPKGAISQLSSSGFIDRLIACAIFQSNNFEVFITHPHLMPDSFCPLGFDIGLSPLGYVVVLSACYLRHKFVIV
jgi:hypothetical protein